MSTAKMARTRSAGTKLTEEEYALVESAAARRGLTVGEWCREELLQAAGEPAAIGTPAEEILLAEVLALRTILLNLFCDMANGGEMHSDRMQELIAKGDGDKREKALQRLQPSVQRAA
jgi:hypothetical protein